MIKFLNRSLVIIESFAIPGAILALGFYFNPSDPFFSRETFPWVWLAPVLVSLRYGLRYGLLALAIVLAAIFYAINISHLEFPSYPIFILGGIILTLICSEFKEAWSKQQRYLQEQTSYLKERIESLSREHSVLRFSHTRLEQSLITKPITLREALLNLKTFLQSSQGILTKDTADRFLQLLAHYTSFEKGALFLNNNGNIDINPIAQLGINKTLALNDPLVKRSLETKETSCFAVNILETKIKSDYLVVAPLLCSDGRLLGLLTISDMPFLMLHSETLRVLSILLAYFSDEVWASQQAIALQKQYPDCPADFAAELFKVGHLWRDIKVDSAILAFYAYPNPDQNTVISELLSTHRSFDRIWQTQNEKCKIMITLMPLATSSTIKGRLDRIDKLIERFPRALIEQKLIEIRYWQISSYPNITQLLDLVIKNETFH